MVNSSAISVIGLMRGMNFFSYHVRPLALTSDEASDDPGEKRNAQVDEDALRDLANRDVDHRAVQAEPLRQHGDEDPSVDRIEQDLEDGIEGHQPGGVFRVALGQFVPHDHHGDAARQADQDQARHVFRIAAQEDDGQHEHQHRADHPVLHQRQSRELSCCGRLRPVPRSAPSPAAGTSSGSGRPRWESTWCRR